MANLINGMLRITARFPVRSASTPMTPITYGVTKVTEIEWADTHSGPARAFAQYLAPTLADVEAGATVRVQWASVNEVEGRVQADVFGEHAPDVLAKAQRLGAVELDCWCHNR